jgi:hypothetical protein
MDESSDKKSQPADVYANQIRLSVGAYDFTLFFGLSTIQHDEGVEQGELQAKEQTKLQAIIRMSPPHAKSLSILLNRFIESYEKDVAPIGLPNALVSHLKGENPSEETDEQANEEAEKSSN